MFIIKEYPSICTNIQGNHELPLMVDVNCRRKNDLFHYHNYLQICYVLAGKMDYSFSDETKTLCAGSAAFILPYQEHHLNTIVSEDTPITVTISFQDSFLSNKVSSFFTHAPQYANFEGMKIPRYTNFNDEETHEANALIREIISEFSRHFDMSYDKLSELIIQFLRMVCKEKQNIENEKTYQYTMERCYAISESIKYMSSHYSEKISIDDLCSVAAMSRSVYMENFKEITGDSPIKFLTKVRLQQAKGALITSELSISEIATKVGFYDKSRLIHAFNELFGVSPLAMKKDFPQSVYDTYENSKLRWGWLWDDEE